MCGLRFEFGPNVFVIQHTTIVSEKNIVFRKQYKSQCFIINKMFYVCKCILDTAEKRLIENQFFEDIQELKN